jgi:virulence factor Mce-like protein
MRWGRVPAARPRRREPGLAGNPILIGALTVLVTIVAVTLAYNATNGLPFVPTYSLHVQAANASELTHGTDVTMGGARVGLVSSVTPSRAANGRPIALLNLHLYESIKPLPVDSRFDIRLKGAIGLKYLQITLGHDRRGYANGATVPVRQTSSEVDFDQVLSMFNPPTRQGVTESTIGFAQALAGRGYDINRAIGALRPLVTDLGPVARNLASRSTDLSGFLRGLEGYSAALVPVAETQAALFTNLNTTFRALAGVAVPSLQDTISQTPPTFEAAIAKVPVIRPFLTDTASLLHQLRPGFATLSKSAPVLADTFEIGTRTLPPTVELDGRTVSLAEALKNYSRNPLVQGGVDRLTLTLGHLRQPLQFLTPVQSSCNYVTLFLRNISSLLSEHVTQGTFLRFIPIAIAPGPNSQSGPSHQISTLPVGRDSGPLHSNPYPYTDSPGQPAECAAGNETFTAGQAVIGNPAGNLGLRTEKTTKTKGSG